MELNVSSYWRLAIQRSSSEAVQDPELALTTLERALVRAERDGNKTVTAKLARHAAVVALKARAPERAERYLNRAVASQPRESTLRAALAQVLFECGRPEDARQQLLRGRELAIHLN